MQKTPLPMLLAVTALALATSLIEARAQRAPPTSQEDCLAQLKLLVEEAHATDLLDDQIDHAENFVALMEQACIAGQFDDAWTFATELDRLLASNK